jgi:hypothetical protein
MSVEPGTRIVDREGRDYVVIRRPDRHPGGVVCEGKPGPGRVRIQVLPLFVLDGQCREWVERRGWHKSSFYFRPRTVRGDHVTSIEPGKYTR